RAPLHLLWHVRTGLSLRRHRTDHAVRPDRAEPRRDDVRQGKAAERLRPDRRGRHRPGPDAQRPPQRGVGTGPRRPAGTVSMPAPLLSVSTFAGPNAWAVVIPAALGLVAIYLLLPRARPYPLLPAAAAGGLALLLAGVWLVRVTALSPETLLFYAFSALAVGA